MRTIESNTKTPTGRATGRRKKETEMNRYEICENNDTDIEYHGVVSARDSREALQRAKSIPPAAKSWSCESASGYPATDDFCLFDPDDQYHSWSAELIGQTEPTGRATAGEKV